MLVQLGSGPPYPHCALATYLDQAEHGKLVGCYAAIRERIDYSYHTNYTEVMTLSLSLTLSLTLSLSPSLIHAMHGGGVV